MNLFVNLFVNLLIAGIVITIIVGILNGIAKDKQKSRNEDEPYLKVKAAADEEDKARNARTQSVVTQTLKFMADHEDDNELVFFLQSVAKGYPYRSELIALEQHDENKGFYSWDLEANDRFGKNMIKKLLATPKPEYPNFAKIVDDETLQLYEQLSQCYTAMHIDVPPIHDSEHHEVDWSNEYFYYTKVNDTFIPQFINSDKKHVFIYPTSLITLFNDVEFERMPIREGNIQFQAIENEGLESGVITIKRANIVVSSRNVEATKKFFDIYQKLQAVAKFKEPEAKEERTYKSNIGDITLILERVNALTGLAQAKADFVSISNYIKIQQLRKSKGLKSQTQAYHCVFTGNPGTGKTTLARLLADVYRELGVVQSGHLVEVDRSKLVGEYVGQTAVKTNELIDKALDGVLFIDEAYSLVQGNQDDFGNEAIATLLKRMEDDRDRLVVILAGYNDEMKKFIDSNPGLQSRFTRYLHFDDYTAPELMEIFCKMAASNDYELDNEARNRLHQILQNAVDTKTKNFGNARYVRNLFEKTIERQASRLTANQSPTENDLRTIKEDDIKEL